MRVTKACIGVILLWLFIFSFLGIVFKLLSSHEAEDLIDPSKIPEINISPPKSPEAPAVIVEKADGGPIIADPLPPVRVDPMPSVATNVVDPDAPPMIASHRSKFAYVTLMHGIDEQFGYRGFLYNALLAKQSLHKLGSTADFIVLVGFTYGNNPNNALINKDLQLLRDFGVILYFLPRLINDDDDPNKKKRKSIDPIKIAFSEMALLKITPFNFLEYDRIQFLDGDVLPYKNMDCLFSLDRNTFNTGSASPVNSGWYLAIPNHGDYVEMKQLAVGRLTHKWDEIKGWGKEIPAESLLYRGSNKAVKKWDFNGASLDQGLVTHYFVLTHGRIQLLDTKVVRKYEADYQMVSDDEASVKEVLHVCEGSPLPTSMFHHYTGRNKPWLQDLRSPKDAPLKLWADLLDGLNTSITSKNIHEHPLKPPLGFFHPNK